MLLSYPYPEISEGTWEILAPRLPGRKGAWGKISIDNRLFINAVFWILRTGASWRALPSKYGDWKNVHRRFCRWREGGVWEIVLDAVAADADFTWLFTPPHAIGENIQEIHHISPWMRMVFRSDRTARIVSRQIAHMCISR